jgi:hypothetical protein
MNIVEAGEAGIFLSIQKPLDEIAMAVKCDGWQLIEPKPFGCGGIVAWPQDPAEAVYDITDHQNRLILGRRGRANTNKFGAAGDQAGLLSQLPDGPCLGVFPQLDEPSREAPPAFFRLYTAFDQYQLSVCIRNDNASGGNWVLIDGAATIFTKQALATFNEFFPQGTAAKMTMRFDFHHAALACRGGLKNQGCVGVAHRTPD